MLFRRISAHLKRQDWFAVGLDLLIVVVGIYIGLQVDAWNSARQDRVVEREYFERLLHDMEESIAAQRYVIDEFDSSINAMDYLAQRLREGSFDSADDALIYAGIDALGWVVSPVTNMVTVRELQSTGKISLIRDIPIRKAIGQLELSYSEAQFSASRNQSLISTSMPEIMTWVYLPPTRAIGEYRSVPGDISYGTTQEPDYVRMLENPVSGTVVSWISAWSKFHATNLANHQEETIRFRDLLLERLEQ